MQSTHNMRTFYTILLTQVLSMIGSRISGLALGFYIFAETGQATPLVMVAFFSMLPMVLASGISGVLADRWDRRYVMMISDFGQAVGTVLLLLSFISGAFEIWHLYVVTFIQSVFGVFQGPAFSASVTMLVPDDQRDRANAVQQLTGPLSGIIAPAIAGLIYGIVGVTGAIVIDLATFLVAVVVIALVRIPRPEQTAEGRALKGTFLKELIGGFQYLFQRRQLFILILHISIVNFLIGGTMTLASAYLLMRTGSESTMGIILALMNIGGLAGGIIIGVWGGTRPRIHTVMVGIIAGGVMLAIFGTSQTPLALTVSLFLMMLPMPMVNAPIMSMLQAKVPPDVQGRVFAVLGQLSTFLMPISMLIVAPLADQVFEPAVGTPEWAAVAPLVGTGSGAGIGLIYVIAGVLMAATTALMYAWPYIRRLEADLPDYVPQAAPVGAGETDTLEPLVTPLAGAAPGD